MRLFATILFLPALAFGQTYDYEYRIDGVGGTVAAGTSPATFQVSASIGSTVEARVRACDPSPANCSAYSGWASYTTGGLQPQPDINGYTATSQNPIVFPEDGCDPAWSGPMCITYPTITGTPPCTGASGVNPSDATQYIIRDVAGWARINTGAETVFAVCAGDYTALAPFTLQRSGTANTDAGLVKIVYYSDDPSYDPRLNAYRRRMGEGDGGIAQIARMSITDKRDFIYFAGITIGSPTVTGNSGLSQPFFNSPHKEGVHFDRIEFNSENYLNNNSFDLRGMNGGVLQNSVLHSCYMRQDEDNNMVYTHPFNENTPRIVNNEMFDCTHHIATGGNTLGQAVGGTIENNDLYYTSARYVNECEQSYWNDQIGGKYSEGDNIPVTEPAFDPNGNCMCGESPISVKAGSNDYGNPLVVANNRIWGLRAANNTGCGMSGTQKGHAIELLGDPEGTTLDSNVMYGGSQWIVQGADQGIVGASYDSIVMQNNIMYGLEAWETGTYAPRGMSFSYPSSGITIPIEMTNNTFGPIVASGDFADAGGRFSSEFNCNVFRDTRAFSGPNLPGNENVSLESTPGASPLPASFTNTGTVVFAANDHVDHVVYIMQQTTPSSTPLASWPKLVLTDSIPTANAGYPPCTLP